MNFSSEEIMAYVDGELDETARGRITTAALADRDLAARIAAERALRDRLNAHFAPMAELPLPPEWLAAIRNATTSSAEIVDLASAREQQSAIRQRRWTTPWAGAAIAASLVLGVLVGARWQGADGTGPIAARDGALVASGGLAKALDTQLTSAQPGAPIRMLGDFRRTGGDFCRVFAGPQASGIACHDKGQWQLQHILPGSTPAMTAYQQAGSHDAELMGYAQAMAVGEPLDAQQELAARATGWR